MINFVSNLPKDLRSGGFSAMNAAAFAAISKWEPCNYVGPINPPALSWQKAWSKLRRVAGAHGSFFFFSERRLKKIADEVHSRCQPDARLDFFHGFTPWIRTRPERPYAALSDCTFRDYVDIFHHREEFDRDDLERIEEAEAAWLRSASRVLFTSDWAAQRGVRNYALDTNRLGTIGIFGELEVRPCDAYAGNKEFVFVSTNFEAKGGKVVLEAFREVRKRNADATLVVIGDRPSDATSEPGITFTGFLRKESADEYQRFLQILAGARALVSATSSDICPLLFIEAGYVGCPVISARNFAIPEIVDDGCTGLLLDHLHSSTLASAMHWMLEHPGQYQQMRKAAWEKARREHSRQQFEQRLCGQLRDLEGAAPGVVTGAAGRG
jgi:glycosyltransferase involved in cell wall biosynthesis